MKPTLDGIRWGLLSGLLFFALILTASLPAAASESSKLESPGKAPVAELSTEEEASRPVLSPRPSKPQATPSVLRLVVGLAIVLSLFFGLVLFLKRSGFGPGSGSGKIQVLETRNLGPRERLVHVCVEQQHFLLGVGTGRVHSIHHWHQSEEEVPS